MTDTTMPAGPIDAKKRIVLLDGLRGFALLGILFANMTDFSAWAFMTPEQMAAVTVGVADSWLNMAYEALVHGKFYALFSLMFGIGFALQLQRIEERGEGTGRYARRLLFLAMFGLLHILLLWIGDILLLYALMGFLLLALRRLSDRALIVGAVICWLIPIAWQWWTIANDFNVFRHFMPIIGPLAQRLDVPFGPGGPAAIYASPDFWMQMRSHVIDLYFRFVIYLEGMRYTKVLGMFMIGLWIGRRGIHANPGAFVPLLKRIALVGLVVGLPIALYRGAVLSGLMPIPEHRILDSITYSISVPLLALAYASIAALAWNAGKEAFFRAFSPIGRMALTNYLMQTVIQSVIFYGWGFGLILKLPLVANVPIAAAIFTAQVFFSKWWLARYRFGPMEWLWRSLTYGKAQPMRLAATSPASA